MKEMIKIVVFGLFLLTIFSALAYLIANTLIELFK